VEIGTVKDRLVEARGQQMRSKSVSLPRPEETLEWWGVKEEKYI